MKNVLKTSLNAMMQFKTIEYSVITNNAEGDTIMTGIDVGRNMMMTANIGKYDQFTDRVMCLGNLGFLRKILDQEQFMNDAGTMTFVEGVSYDGDDIFSTINFKGKSMSVKYCAVDPKVIKEHAHIRKMPPTINDMQSDYAFSIEAAVASEFKQAVMLQKMMSASDAVVFLEIVDGNMMFRLPYGKNGVDLIIKSDVPDGLIPPGLQFDTEKMERLLASVSLYENGEASVSSKFFDVKYSGAGVSYHVRIPKKTLVKKL